MIDLTADTRPARSSRPPRKTASGSSRSNPNKHAYRIRPQDLQTHWMNRPAATTTASGVSVYGYRYLDPVHGRWLNRDPIGERGGLNLYAIAHNDAINNIDILGRKAGSTCNGSGDLGNRKGKLTGSGIINAASPRNAGVFERDRELLDQINNLDALQEFLGLAQNAARRVGQGVGEVLVDDFGEAFPDQAFDDFAEQVGDAALENIQGLNDALMNDRNLARFTGARMDVFFEWQECECKSILFWSWYRWSGKGKYVYHCHFNIDGSVVGGGGMEGRNLWFGPEGQKAGHELTGRDVTTCMRMAFEAFKREVLDQ